MGSRTILFLWLTAIVFTSCSTTNNMGSIKVEMMKPGLFTFLNNMDTIAIFKRDFYKSDTISFTFVDVESNEALTDSLLSYQYLSNKCVDALANYFNNEGYFLKVINYRDTMNHLFSGTGNQLNDPTLPYMLGVDACIFLDYFILKDRILNNSYYFDSDVIDNFPEFASTTKMESIRTNLLWTISFRGDTSLYICKEPEDLHYGNSVNPELFGSDRAHRLLLQNVAGYLGESFAKKLIPAWEQTERTYYKSNNTSMRQAENYFLNEQWMEAAEIYKRQTSNKNPNIAAKAAYNMALICEMEENIDAASDWLYRSNLAYKHANPQHQFNCKEYSDKLRKRKLELEVLAKQVRNYASKSDN